MPAVFNSLQDWLTAKFFIRSVSLLAEVPPIIIFSLIPYILLILFLVEAIVLNASYTVSRLVVGAA